MRHENPATMTLWDRIDTAAPTLGPIAGLFEWATNEDPRRGTCWFAFLDLMGWSDEHLGQNANVPGYRPGYVEIDKLAKALTCYSERPRACWDFVCEIESAIE
jgi:hypothetical protein